MIYGLFCCLLGFILALGYLFLYNRAWYKLNKDSPTLAPIVGNELKRMVPGVVFWALLGTTFGLVGTFLMVSFTDLPTEHLEIWLAIGGGGGFIWGVVWGVVYGIGGGFW